MTCGCGAGGFGGCAAAGGVGATLDDGGAGAGFGGVTGAGAGVVFGGTAGAGTIGPDAGGCTLGGTRAATDRAGCSRVKKYTGTATATNPNPTAAAP